jgi:hypothetical protein
LGTLIQGLEDGGELDGGVSVEMRWRSKMQH